MKKLAFFFLLAGLLLGPVLVGDAAPLGTFLRGSQTGCFLGNRGSWEELTAPKIQFSVGTSLKTDRGGWGTLVFPFGSLVLRGNSQVRIEPSGLLLQTGSFKAFVRKSPQGFKFRIPSATLSVRGTVFSAEAAGGLQVEAGIVEVGISGQAPETVSDGETWGQTADADQLPESLKQFEGALKAEHDGKSEVAVKQFLELVKSPAYAGLPTFRAHLVEKALVDFARAGLSLTHALAGALREAVKEFPGALFNSLQTTLSGEEAKASRSLLGFAPDARNGKSPDPRELVAEALLAEMTADDDGMNKAIKDLTKDPKTRVQAEGAGEFWGTSLTYLQAMTDPRSIVPARITVMISPSGLRKLSPKAAAHRVSLATRLPAETLEAQGLYFLLKALWADKKTEKAAWLMEFFRSHYPGSPWLDRAEKLVSQRILPEGPVQSGIRTPAASVSATLSHPSGLVAGSSKIKLKPGSNVGMPGKTNGNPSTGLATGTTQAGESAETPTGSAESLNDSF